MSQNLKKRIFTSVILFLLLIFFNFTIFFVFGLLMVCVIICIEFNKIISKLFGGLLLRSHPKSSTLDKFNFKYFVLQLLVISYVLFIFGGTSYELHGGTGSPIFFLYVLFVCFFSDTGGYVIGKLFGGKKLIKISPNKTISGSIGSFLFSVLPLLLFYNYNQYDYPLSIDNFLFCLLLSFVCQLGDLFISYIKRKAKIKNTGNILPGHGGFLDRVDGIIFALPFVFFYYNDLNTYFGKFKFFFDKLM